MRGVGRITGTGKRHERKQGWAEIFSHPGCFSSEVVIVFINLYFFMGQRRRDLLSNQPIPCFSDLSNVFNILGLKHYFDLTHEFNLVPEHILGFKRMRQKLRDHCGIFSATLADEWGLANNNMSPALRSLEKFSKYMTCD